MFNQKITLDNESKIVIFCFQKGYKIQKTWLLHCFSYTNILYKTSGPQFSGEKNYTIIIN